MRRWPVLQLDDSFEYLVCEGCVAIEEKISVLYEGQEGKGSLGGGASCLREP